jgi:membrane-associated phospholipid phosphatase
MAILLRMVTVLSLSILPAGLFADESADTSTSVSLLQVFHHLPSHLLGSFTCDYGAEHILAAGASYGIITSGIDWKWYMFAQRNPGVSSAGFVSVGVGGMAPAIVPLGLYVYGRVDRKRDLQVTALALGQSALISVGISSAYKAVTGRRPPDDHYAGGRDFSDDFKAGFLQRGAYDGWPSSHTANAFAMATTLAELYPENTTLKIISYTYATLIGIGVSTNIHWFSDAVAGAMIGYGVGKTVGSDFNVLGGGREKKQAVQLQVSGNGVGVAYRF